ncbi:MAG: CDP-diacylglycerol--glycerol-3-phosphate 3-phosphatidyltransferase [Candidatus Hydrogenedentota bacterium]
MKHIPNLLTLLRFLLAMFLVIILYHANTIKYFIALSIFTAAMITDYFDGMIARKYKTVTEFGKTMDPLADKIIVACGLIYFSLKGFLFYMITILILVREFGITIYRFFLLKRGKIVPAERLGKLKAGFQMAGICVSFLLLIINEIINSNDVLFYIKLAMNIFFGFTLFLTYLSLYPYIIKKN